LFQASILLCQRFAVIVEFFFVCFGGLNSLCLFFTSIFFFCGLFFTHKVLATSISILDVTYKVMQCVIVLPTFFVALFFVVFFNQPFDPPVGGV
jgi:hypothetical protein